MDQIRLNVKIQYPVKKLGFFQKYGILNFKYQNMGVFFCQLSYGNLTKNKLKIWKTNLFNKRPKLHMSPNCTQTPVHSLWTVSLSLSSLSLSSHDTKYLAKYSGSSTGTAEAELGEGPELSMEVDGGAPRW